VPASDISAFNPFQTLQRHRNFRLFWFGQTLSLIGTWMQSMAEGWLALELSNSAFLVGLVAAAQSFPILLLSMHAGVVVDRADKLRIVKTAQTLLAVQASVLWWFTWSHHLTVTWLVALATANGLIVAFEIPARQSLVIELVGRDDLPGAIALNSSGFNLARIVGPSIGAIIIARLGIAWCFGVNALSYVAVLIGLFMIQLPEWLPPERIVTPLEGIREAFDYVRETPTVSSLLWLVTVFSVLGVPYLTLMPVVARDRLGLGAGGYGALLACVGIGGLAGALSLAAVGDRTRRGVLLFTAAFSYSTMLIAFSLVRSAVAAYPILLAVGFTMIASNATGNATLQRLVPNELRGRMMATYSFIAVGLSSAAGSLLAGSVAHVVGVSWAIGGGGLIMLAYTTWAFRNHHELASV
jgi:MFS family permease